MSEQLSTYEIITRWKDYKKNPYAIQSIYSQALEDITKLCEEVDYLRELTRDFLMADHERAEKIKEMETYFFEMGE